MIKSYNKGDTLFIEYSVDNVNIIQCTGVVFELSYSSITLVHNFSGKFPIDSTKILLKDMVKSERVFPKEINSIDDL